MHNKRNAKYNYIEIPHPYIRDMRIQIFDNILYKPDCEKNVAFYFLIIIIITLYNKLVQHSWKTIMVHLYNEILYNYKKGM